MKCASRLQAERRGAGEDHYEYYTKSRQRLEDRPNGEAPKAGVSLFVFGLRYIDDVVWRMNGNPSRG